MSTICKTKYAESRKNLNYIIDKNSYIELPGQMSSDMLIKYYLAGKAVDWRTSTGVAHPPIDQQLIHSTVSSKFAKNAKRPGCIPLVVLPESWKVNQRTQSILRQKELATSTASEFVHKHTYTKDRIHHAAPSCERVLYAQSFLKHPSRHFPPKPPKHLHTYYQSEFTKKIADVPKNWELYGLLNLTTCGARKVEALGEPQLNLAQGGIAVNLDPYATTNFLLHRRFTQYELKGILYEKPIGNFHDTYEVEELPSSRRNILPDISVRLCPIYDSLVFHTKSMLRVQPRRTEAVPHRGLLTESQEQYRLH